MKIIKYFLIYSLIAALAVSCEKGLDPINSVDPGTDATAPELVVSYPVDGKNVLSPDSVATITIKCVATDDFELKSVVIQLDGVEIANLNSFLDYRRADISYNYNGMLDGDHVITVTATDIADKSTGQTVSFTKITVPPYDPLEDEVLYLSFDGAYLDRITGNQIPVVGSPGYAEGKLGDAYAGATDSYLTYPTEGILGTEFSVAFWYKLNPEPARGGIIAISRPYEEYNDTTRYKGFRMLRENSGANQNIGINFGVGTTEVWMNPFITITPDGEWIHIAVSISDTMAIIYVNGEVVMEKPGLTAPINWQDCSSISIGSGSPNFTYWDHFSDLSLYDEMHFFKRAITAEEVLSFYNLEK
ncbi:MAG: hypothetical protein K9H16_11080 [Bacteroidales bacterium]|nr:hypothetical protein [Bacteroidales bacterium]